MEERVHVKVVLLGQSNSGKSCLVKRYLEGSFDGDTQSSVGCAFAARSLHVGNVELCLGIWDTCGQERYETLTRIYYQNAAAAIVCHDLTDEASFKKTSFWIEELKEHNESCRIYLVGTKADLLDQGKERAVDKEKLEATARDVKATLVETSSKTGHNVEDLFMCISEDFVGAGLHRQKKRERSIRLHEAPSKETQEEIRKSGCRCYGGGRKQKLDDGPT